MLRLFHSEDKKAAEAVGRELGRIAQAVDAIAEALSRGGRLFYIGAGTSGRLGVLDASECPPTFNLPPEMVQAVIAGGEAALRSAVEAVEDSAQQGERDLLSRGFHAGDILVGIAASGRTPYVLGAVAAAAEIGAMTVGVSCVAGSELSRAVKIPIEVVCGPEVIAGSTRLKAGTATKMVLNMLSSGAMVKLGYVHSNLMVNVQPRNEKLVDRAERIIMDLAGVDRREAAALLESSGRDVRTAVVMGKLKLSRDEASNRLAECGGVLRRAVGSC
jgi:N-acetylmuramic acid 6-phosphate etherase